MYPLGILFGLGFDTSSEVALLGIASIQASKGTSIWLILIFPILFTGKSSPSIQFSSPPNSNSHEKRLIHNTKAGMALLDTLDAALMSALYTTPSLAKDPVATLYYSIVLTVLTVAVAVVIGSIQLLTLVLNVAPPNMTTGVFWEGVSRAGERFDVIGESVVSCFVQPVNEAYLRRWRHLRGLCHFRVLERGLV